MLSVDIEFEDELEKSTIMRGQVRQIKMLTVTSDVKFPYDFYLLKVFVPKVPSSNAGNYIHILLKISAQVQTGYHVRNLQANAHQYSVEINIYLSEIRIVQGAHLGNALDHADNSIKRYLAWSGDSIIGTLVHNIDVIIEGLSDYPTEKEIGVLDLHENIGDMLRGKTFFIFKDDAGTEGKVAFG